MTAFNTTKLPPPNATSWQMLCLAEAIRLREEHWGPLDDTDAVRHARQGPEQLDTRIVMRAQWLGQRDGLDALIARWRTSAIISLVTLLIVAAAMGVATAVGTLGDGSRTVNVLWAVAALLGLNTLTFLLWAASFLLAPKKTTWLGQVWLWATQKFARGPDGALIPHALMNLLKRAGAFRWLFGSISHGLWIVGLSAALLTLLAMLSTASYRFVWATTLLQPDTFVSITQALGWLPEKLGFPTPSQATILASDNNQVLPTTAQTQWSIWLIGVVLVYGLIPRCVVGGWCLINTLRSRQRLQITDTLPGYMALRDRLLPIAQPSGIDRPVDPLFAPQMRSDDASPANTVAPSQGQPLLVCIEFPHDTVWPPSPLPDTIFNAGNLDSREQRHRLQDTLSRNQPPRLLIVCDAHQTPDRGTLQLIASLTHLADQTKVWLYPTPEGETTRSRAVTWHERLSEAGMPSTSILKDSDQPLRWLEVGDA